MNQAELEQLVEQKEGLLNLVALTTQSINAQQVIVEANLNLFGFKKLRERANIVIYGKEFKPGHSYELMLDLTEPHLLILHKTGQKKSHGFKIDSFEDFRDLIIFANLV